MNADRKPMLHVVHCVDTEGPLHETLDATFERLDEIFGLKLEPSRATLDGLQKRTVDLGSDEIAATVARTFSPANLAYNDDWDKIDDMLDRLDHPSVRRALPDSTGGGWHVNWHCLAHFGYDPARNPRCRALGAHAVFDHYRDRYGDGRDGNSIHWHFHPVPRVRQANFSATSYFTNPTVFEIVSKRILERQWFPCVNRPGFHAERPDSHWFLEQWMPFDMANNNVDAVCDQPDLLDGRFGDWRRAPMDWMVYHPDHDDYQSPGRCRRAIARCLYLGGRYFRLTQEEVDCAFESAQTGTVVLAFTHHDFRDIVPDVRDMQRMIENASRRYPGVPWRYSDAADAMRHALNLSEQPHLKFSLELETKGGDAHQLSIRTDRAPFGPQPWLCYQLTDGSVWHDNLDFTLDENHWQFTFEKQTAPISQVRRIGLATNTADGRTTIVNLDPGSGKQTVATLN